MNQALRPILPIDLWIDDPVLEIEPDPLVGSVVEALAGDGPLLPHGARLSAGAEVAAGAVLVVGDQVGLALFPTDDPLV